METQKNDEKNIVLELKRQLGRMMVQVDYMYRNDREMSRLDLDVMMERVRDLYDLLCDYQAGKIDVEEKPEYFEKEINEGGELVNHDVEFEIETPQDDSYDAPADEEADEEKADDEKADDEKADDEKADDGKDDDDDWEDEDDEIFRVEPEDNSLAARLQHTPVSDIKAAMGINDKMMIINDLFKGSVDRFNKSVDALNDFPTLSGSRIYLSELQIELQWDVESPAYKMFNDLVERRFV